MTEWLVKLKGEELDLRDLPALLRSPDLSVIEEDGSYYLTSAEFNSLTDAGDVLRRAKRLIPLLNGAAKLWLGNFGALDIGAVARVGEEGKHHQFIFPESITLQGRGRLRAVADVTPGDSKESLPKPTVLQSWVEVAARDAKVEKALRIFGSRAHNWVNLYNVYEAIQSDVGLKKITDDGWATKTRIRLFKHTADSEAAVGDDARHGHQKDRPPKNPMSLSEAKALIETILRRWLLSKCE
jgi:hypothetical protein